MKKYKSLLISNFNIDNFAALLANNKEEPNLEVCKASSYGEVSQILLDQNNPCWWPKPDFAIIWTQPQQIINSLAAIMDNEKLSEVDILREVDDFSSQIINIKKRAKYIFVPSWAIPYEIKGFDLLHMRPGIGLRYILMTINLRLSDNLSKASNVFVLDAQKWIAATGKDSYNPKLWYMAKVPFANEFFREAVKDIKAVMNAVMGLSKKLIILDLDDTLWGGIVGELGWENINLGGHDYAGEAFVDFQKELKAFSNRGIILAIASKNDEEIALDAIEHHPAMVLKQDDFAARRINWEDKVKNIIDIVEELNIGLNSVVFIDDNPFERSHVREALPEVFVPEWPDDCTLYKKTLEELGCFQVASINEEDINKSKMYTAEKERKKLKKKVPSLKDWLKTLEIKVKVDSLNNSNLKRATQLLNKTNQMNLATRRLNENELKQWAEQENNFFWVFHVSDKIGDSGLVGLVGLTSIAQEALITDFVLSCRVFGRQVEESMIFVAYECARNLKLKKIKANYIQTKKNKPCFDFFCGSCFNRKNGNNTFFWNLKEEYLQPPTVEIVNISSSNI